MGCAISKDDILNDIIRVGLILDKPPTCREYKKCGVYGESTVRLKFGTWNTALKLALNVVNFDKTPRIELECDFCNSVLTRHRSQEFKHNFCNASCSASFNNTRRVSKLTNECTDCGLLIESGKKRCVNCIESGKVANKTLARFLLESKTVKSASKYAYIRTLGRDVLKTVPEVCNKI